MNYFKVSEFLHDIFGEKQSFLEIFASILFVVIESLFFIMKVIFGFPLIISILKEVNILINI